MGEEELGKADAELSEALAVIDESESVLARVDEAKNKHRESALLFLSSLQSEVSRRTARTALRRIARELGLDPKNNDSDVWLKVPWCDLGPEITSGVQAILLRKGSPNSAKLAMSMLRGVLRQAKRLGHISADRYDRVVDTGKIRGQRLRAGRMLTDEEVKTLFGWIAELPGSYGTMLRALFAAALGGGLRREELSTLKVSSFRPQEGLVVRGKGDKERLQPLPEWAREALVRWVDARGKLGLKSESLFVLFSPSGGVHDAPLSPREVWRLIKRTRDDAGVDFFTPHDMRRTFCSNMLNVHPLSTVQRLMGHASPTTTALYDRRDDSVGAAAVETTLSKWAPEEKKERVKCFRKKGAVVEATWVRQQVKLLLDKGLSLEQAAKALAKVGVTWGGRPIERGDLT